MPKSDNLHGISVIVNTFNEEANIERCLTSVKWANEVVLVDMHSEDRTVEIARRFTEKIFQFERMGYVEPARNFALSKATMPWVLVVDADEVIPPSLTKKLDQLTQQPEDVVAYYVPEKNIMFGRWIRHTGWWPDQHIRFFKNGHIRWDDAIHSVPVVSGGKTGSLPFEEVYAIEHYPYKSRRDFMTKLNNYTDKEAKKLYDQGVHYSTFRALKRAFGEFYFRYWRARGFKDGRDGFILSVYMAFYYFLAYTKVLDLANNADSSES